MIGLTARKFLQPSLVAFRLMTRPHCISNQIILIQYPDIKLPNHNIYLFIGFEVTNLFLQKIADQCAYKHYAGQEGNVQEFINTCQLGSILSGLSINRFFQSKTGTKQSRQPQAQPPPSRLPLTSGAGLCHRSHPFSGCHS